MDATNIVPDLDSGKLQKHILNNSSGYVKPGELVAIMGPSGSGKTSLLNVIAGRQVLSKGSSFSGSITVNGRNLERDDFGKIAAFV
jgi:ABC-type multidrug transport system ATPase subunit